MYNLKSLNPRHYKIIELTLRGLTVGQIATELSMTTQAITIVTHSPNFQHEYAMQKTIVDSKKHDDIATEHSDVAPEEVVNSKLREATLIAVDKLTEAMESDDESLALKATLETLDRGGHPRSVKTENVETLHVSLSNEAAQRIADAITLDVDDSHNCDHPKKFCDKNKGTDRCNMPDTFETKIPSEQIKHKIPSGGELADALGKSDAGGIDDRGINTGVLSSYKNKKDKTAQPSKE